MLNLCYDVSSLCISSADPEDDSTGSEKAFPFNPLLMPHHVISLEASNIYVLHRFNQYLEAAGIDPTQARVMPEPWPRGFRTDKQVTSLVTESSNPLVDNITGDNLPEVQDVATVAQNDGNVPEDGADSETNAAQKYETLETCRARFDRRLENYRTVMAPVAAVERIDLVNEAHQLGEGKLISPSSWCNHALLSLIQK